MEDSTRQQNSSTRPQSASGPRKSSDVLTERLIQIRERAELAEQQRDKATALNRSLSEEVNVLRQQLGETSKSDGVIRNAAVEAELQALRQETAMLRHSVEEKDKVLEDLASQCRGLEDVLEDRDREMDSLHRELEQSRDDSEASKDSMPSRLAIDGDGPVSDSPHALQAKDTTKVLAGSGGVYSSTGCRLRKTRVLASIGGLLVGALILSGFFILSSDDVDFSDQQPQPVSRPEPYPSPHAAAAIAEPERSINAATVRSSPPAVLRREQDGETRPEPLRDRLNEGSSGPHLVGLPGGEFVMGSTRVLVAGDEQPSHRVRLQSFYIGKYEITFAQYDRFAQSTGRPLPDDAGWGRGNRPVINVSWEAAKAYTRWLSHQTGKTYRLPTEAEWEYAARGGVSARFWWGYSPESGRAVCFDCGSRWDNRSTAPVGSLLENPYGLYDTAGNVMEWVEDCYNRDYAGAPADGRAWLAGDCGQRMTRGGAYNKPFSSLSSSARSQLPQDAGFDMVGFRVARN